MVVNKYLISIVLLISIQSCCRFKNPDLLSENEKKQGLIDPDYLNKEPIAQLINLPVMSQTDTFFVLKKDTKIKIYAIGEADIGRFITDPRYLYKGDEIEYYFDISQEKKPTKPISILLSRKGVNIGDSTCYSSGNKTFSVHYDIKLRKYEVSLSIPWKSLHLSPIDNSEIGFNVTLGDNDDKLQQKARLIWVGTKDILYETQRIYGKIRLSSKRRKMVEKDVLPSILIEKPHRGHSLEALPNAAITNLVSGQINEAEDFSASVKSSWDAQNLYIFTEVFDNTPRFVDLVQIKKSADFHDFGTIEDSSGEVVWEMRNFYTKHAGGAQKNQIADTIIALKAGKYLLKYTTDESHSWNRWDDRPPKTPFYGIVLYDAQN